MSPLLGNYVAPVPAQQRRRQALVPRQRRRDLPVPEHHRRRAARHRRRRRRRPRLPHGLLPDGRRAHRVRRRVHRRGHPAADRHGDQFGVIDDRPEAPRTASRPSWRSRPTRRACPTAPARSSRRWATTSPPPTRCSRRSPQDADNPTLAPRHGRRHRPLLRRTRARAGVYDFVDNDVPGSTDRDRDYWRDVGTLDAYYDAHMDLISVEPVFNLYNEQVAAPQRLSRSLPPAKFVHAGAGPARPRRRLRRLAGRDRLRRHRHRLGPLPRRAPALVGARSRTRCCSTARRGRAARPGPSRDPRQERRGSRTGAGRPRPRARPARAVSP